VTLLLSRDDVAQLIGPKAAIEVTEMLVREEVAGTVTHLPPLGGGAPGQRTEIRVVAGALHGLGRTGVRIGYGTGVATLFDTRTREFLAVMGYPFSHLRVGATMALAARYLARPDARSVGYLGSGSNALAILQCLQVVRHFEGVEVYSPTPEHRQAFATRATEALGVPVRAHDTLEAAIDGVDIIAVGTNSPTPVLHGDQLRPGVHVTSMGLPNELDASVYLRADQFVAASREAEIDEATPSSISAGRATGGALYQLLREKRLTVESIIELGALVTGDVAPRNGPNDITVFRESRGGPGDIALASYAYERARQLGRGIEFSF